MRPWARWRRSGPSTRAPAVRSTPSYRAGNGLLRACSTGTCASRWSSTGKVVDCLDAALEVFADTNRLLNELGTAAEECRDLRSNWDQWRVEWQRKLERNEIQFLRSVADLQGAFQHRSNLMDASYRDAVRAQHQEFTAALERSGNDIQQRLWADLERIRLEYERLIFSELKTIRQRAAVSVPAPPPAEPRPSGSGRTALRLRPLRGALPRLRRVRQGRPADLPVRISRTAARCSISAAGAASSWK